MRRLGNSGGSQTSRGQAQSPRAAPGPGGFPQAKQVNKMSQRRDI